MPAGPFACRRARPFARAAPPAGAGPLYFQQEHGRHGQGPRQRRQRKHHNALVVFVVVFLVRKQLVRVVQVIKVQLQRRGCGLFEIGVVLPLPAVYGIAVCGVPVVVGRLAVRVLFHQRGGHTVAAAFGNVALARPAQAPGNLFAKRHGRHIPKHQHRKHHRPFGPVDGACPKQRNQRLLHIHFRTSASHSAPARFAPQRAAAAGRLCPHHTPFLRPAQAPNRRFLRAVAPRFSARLRVGGKQLHFPSCTFPQNGYNMRQHRPVCTFLPKNMQRFVRLAMRIFRQGGVLLG